MDGFRVDGIAGIPQDPRSARDAARRVDGSKRRTDPTDVSFEFGEAFQIIEDRRTELIEEPFVRPEKIAAALRDLETGRLDSRAAIEEAAERMLNGDAGENLDAVEGL